MMKKVPHSLVDVCARIAAMYSIVSVVGILLWLLLRAFSDKPAIIENWWVAPVSMFLYFSFRWLKLKLA